MQPWREMSYLRAFSSLGCPQATLDEALAMGPSRVVVDVATADRQWLYQVFAEHGQHVVAGLQVAHDAYEMSLGGKAAPVLDGLTGQQRVFLGWAQVWRAKARQRQPFGGDQVALTRSRDEGSFRAARVAPTSSKQRDTSSGSAASVETGLGVAWGPRSGPISKGCGSSATAET